MMQQQLQLEATFDEWKGSTNQRDDVLVVGIAVNDEHAGA